MKRILVADDEPTIRSLVAEILSENGYSVVLAQSGSEALRMISTEKPDAVLLDMMMPDINGWAVLEACRKAPPEVSLPIVVMSTVVAPDEAKRLGAQGCLPKPFDIDEMVALLHSLVERPVPAAAIG